MSLIVRSLLQSDSLQPAGFVVQLMLWPVALLATVVAVAWLIVTVLGSAVAAGERGLVFYARWCVLRVQLRRLRLLQRRRRSTR